MNGQEPLRQELAEATGLPPDEALVRALVGLHELVVAGLGDGALRPGESAAWHDAMAEVVMLAEQGQHLGLADVAVRLGEHITTTREAPRALRERLARFVMAAANYVAQPGERITQEALLGCVAGLVPEDELEIMRLMVGLTPEEPAVVITAVATEVPAVEGPDQIIDAAVLQGFLREAQPVLEQLAGAAARLVDGAGQEAADAVVGELESLARGAECTGLAGLAAALELAKDAFGRGRLGAETLARLVPAAAAYIEEPTMPDRAERLAALIPFDDPAAVARSLGAVMVVQAAPAAPARAVTASIEDTSLVLPDDINPELLDGLLLELPVQSAAFARAVHHIVEGHATRDDLEVAKRAAHTLKGAANTVGVRGIAALTHALEDILVALSDHGVLPNLGLSQTLAYASDCLEAMSEALSGVGAPPQDALNVLQDVLNWANRIDAQGIDAARGEAVAEVAEGSAAGGQIPRPDPEPAAMLRVPAALVDELLRLVGETMTSSAQIQTRTALAMAQARATNRQNVLLQQLVGELETMVDLRGMGLPGRALAGRTVASEFDALEFEHYNELQTLSRQLMEVVTDAREMGLAAEEHLAALAELQEEQARLQLENQHAVMGTRMVPVSTVFSRLQRGVRQACRILDKEVALVLRGEETVMDGNVLHELIDALMHLLRNAVDHGIEPAATRVAAGKPAAGRIELEFRREGDYIAVRCADDGRGLDLDAIRASAERHGIIASAAELTRDEVARLILLPGFSTRHEATQVSGRGIGMDAVNAKVLALKGTLHLASRPGEGLTVELKLPVTLLATHALLVRVRNRVVALSTRGIEDLHYVAAAPEDVAAGLKELTGEVHEVVDLESVLALPGDRRARGRHGWPVVMVRLESGARRAVVVQEVIESRNVVVKPLGPYVPRIQGLVGATILGDGSVAPVIDLPERLYSFAERVVPPRSNDEERVGAEGTGRRRVLVVEDSISARRALVHVMRDAGYDVRTAADGLEAIGLLEQRVPDLIITDMEMPRLNGLELAQHVRARSATGHVPVIMVTSRSTEKHRRQAELAGVDVYLTKPFNDRDLLQHVARLVASTA